MKKNVLISAVLTVALLPAVGMSAQKVNSFEQDFKYCDSWAWQDNKQSDIKTASNEQIAFGEQTQNGIGW